MNRLDRLSVRGFKSIRELDLELGTVNVLIGGNGAGKSNLLSLLRMLRAMATGDFQEWIARAGGAKSVLHYGPKVTPAMEVGLEFQVGSDSGSYHARLASAPVDTLVFAQEDLLGTGQQGNGGVHIGHRASVEGFVAKLTAHSMVAIRASKRALYGGYDIPLAEAIKLSEYIFLNVLAKSRDYEEGLRAFLEKRKSVWQDK